MVRIYNSLSRKKEPLPQPSRRVAAGEAKAKKLRLFVCGPTVYDYPHIGHARTYIFFDFFAKYLRSQRYAVDYLQNITDIDDKIIKRAEKEGKKPTDIAKFYTKAYLEDMKKLGIDAVTKYAPATEFIPQIIAQTERLIKKGYGYEIPGDGYYFDISKFKDYGKLSRRSAEQAEHATSRIDESVGKRNKGDFCLWKFSHANAAPPLSGSGPLRQCFSEASNANAAMRIIDGEPVWESSLGNGRPGWHIEDTAITEKFFGPQYDIHGGGVDLKFPHHEAEIAQQEAASGKKPLVKIWMHTGILVVNGEKMSKSLGNFVTIRSFLKNNDPAVLRLMVFQHNYRSPMDYNEKLLEGAKNTWDDIKLFMNKLDFLISKPSVGKKISHLFDFPGLFDMKLRDDINTPQALAVIFRAIYYGNKMLFRMDRDSLLRTRKFLTDSLSLFGILPAPAPKIPRKIENLVEKREKLRSNQQFIQSDALRKEADALGYIIEDTPAGQFICQKNHN